MLTRGVITTNVRSSNRIGSYDTHIGLKISRTNKNAVYLIVYIASRQGVLDPGLANELKKLQL